MKIPGKQLLGDFLDFVSGSFRARIQADVLTDNRVIELPDKDGTIALLSDLGDQSMGSLSKRVDEVNGVYYVGEAVPGTLESSPLWRIKKISTIEADATVQWADSGLFTQIWANRLSLSYN